MKTYRRKNRSIWIDMVMSLSILILGAFAFFLYTQSSAFPKKSASSIEIQREGETKQVESVYPTIHINIETSNDPRAPFSIQYPVSENTKFNEMIDTYIQAAKKTYLQKAIDRIAANKDSKGELNISFQTFTHHSGHYSFVIFSTMQFNDQKAGKTEIRSFRLHPETGEQLSVADLFGRDPSKLEELSKKVRGAIEADPAMSGKTDKNTVSQATQPLWQNFRNFALTEDDILFYFPSAILTDNRESPAAVSLSLDSVDRLLAKGFAKETENEEDNSGLADAGTDGESAEQAGSEADMTSDETADAMTEDSPDSSETPPVHNSAKKVALTFDDGPDESVTGQILDTLKKHDVKATFYMLGSRVEYYPDMAVRVKEEGHEIGNHTWNHKDLTKLNTQQIQREIEKTSAIIEDITGERPASLRPPYGAVNKTVRGQTALPVALWSVDTLDWKYRDADHLLRIVQNKAEDGSVILMHDIHQSTADGLDAVITYLKNEGYTFVTMTELESNK